MFILSIKVKEISLKSKIGRTINAFQYGNSKDVYINWMDCWNGNGSQKMRPIFRHFGRSPHAQKQKSCNW